MAVFVHRGELADVFDPGNYRLTADNLPILSTLQGWKYGFDSPFRSEVYFVNTRQVTELKWGTPNPIMLRDPEFGPIRLRAFGTYALKATEPKALLRELVGTDQTFDVGEIQELMRGLIGQTLADVLGESEIAALDLARSYSELSERLRTAVLERVDDEYGLDVPQLFIVNISLPEEVERALDTRTSMGVIGDMTRFQQYQMGQAMTAAAENPSGGGASTGVGLGMGFAMANQMVQGLGGQPGGAAPGAAPPPVPAGPVFHVAQAGQSQGPFPVQQVLAAIASGQITRQTLVWSPGMAQWTAAGEVPQLAGAFGPPPPPPPAGT
jgi:membrane protease subunit (stomatin/prohibitin family)